jgi:hypothetical protein
VPWYKDLADELHKPIRKKFPKRRVIVYGIDEVWAIDLVDMKHFSRINKGYKYLLTVIDIFSKYAWAIPIKSKKPESSLEAFENILESSNRKPEKIWCDGGNEFKGVFQKFLDKNKILKYMTHNEGKSVVVERFNRTLKERMWKQFTIDNTNQYLDMLPLLMEKYI